MDGRETSTLNVGACCHVRRPTIHVWQAVEFQRYLLSRAEAAIRVARVRKAVSKLKFFKLPGAPRPAASLCALSAALSQSGSGLGKHCCVPFSPCTVASCALMGLRLLPCTFLRWPSASCKLQTCSWGSLRYNVVCPFWS